MAKGKTGKAFFEVYGSQQQKGDIPVGDKAGEEKIPVDFPTYGGEELIVISDIADRLHEGGEGRGGGRGALVPIIIIASVCGIGLAVGMFFLGHSVGKVKAPGEEVAAKASAAAGPEVPKIEKRPAGTAEAERKRLREGAEVAVSTPEKPLKEMAAPLPPPARVVVAPPPESTDTWTIRIITYTDVQKNLEKAAGVADFLQSATGHDAFVARLGNKLVVCLGEFGSKRNPELLELQKQVRDFEYENRKQFISSYPVRIK